MKKLLVFLLLGLMCSTSAFAAIVYKTGNVTSIKMFENVVVIYVDTIDTNACVSGQRRVAIRNDNPIYSAVVSSALAAKATGSPVEIGYHDTCTNQAGSWDFESFWIK